MFSGSWVLKRQGANRPDRRHDLSSRTRTKLRSRRLVLERLEEKIQLDGSLDLSSLADVSGKVSVGFSGMVYNRRTGDVVMDATVTNTSLDTMPSTLYMVLNSWAPGSTIARNADGLTSTGKPYYVLDRIVGDVSAAYVPGEATAPEKLSLGNTGRGRISLDTSVYAVPAVLTLDQGQSAISVPEGGSGYGAFTVSVVQVDGVPIQVSFDQTVDPANGGITLDPDASFWNVTSDVALVVNENIAGNQPGTYLVASTATATRGGVTISSDSDEMGVNVYESGSDIAVLWEPGAEPDGLPIGAPTDVKFSASVTGVSGLSASLLLEQVDENGSALATLGYLTDDGLNGDPVAGDNVYTGVFSITGAAEGNLYFQSSLTLGVQTFVSPTTTVVVTPFPVGLAPSDPTKIVVDPTSGESLYSNEVLVGFVPGTPSTEIVNIAATLGATIAGTIPSLGLFQMQIPGDGTAAGVYTVVDAFMGFGEVEYAEPNYIGGATEVAPDSSQQWGPVKIRADEAWVLSQGNMLVAVVDSGVDYNHADLSGRVVKGKDYVNNDNDPMDDNSHGTHVAGIIGAKRDGSGISGIAAGKILAVKVANATGNISFASAAAGIRYAADNGAKIVNMSFRFKTSSTALQTAVNYAIGKGAMLVAAAGNDGSSTKVYPAGYSGVFVVGATDSSDARPSYSNYGSWVNIAAPGDSIYSTVPTNNYGNKSGTSMAAPHVAGAASVVWSQHPEWTASQVRERLEKTAAPLDASLQLGAGRLDLFEAVFNGSFETGDTAEWETTGTTASLDSLGPIAPQHRERMGYASTGPSGDQVAAQIWQTFTIQPGVTSLPIEFQYTFVTEEYDEWVGTIYDDSLFVKLIAPDGTESIIATESVNTSSFSFIGGIDFPGGDDTVGWTGWKTASATLPVTAGGEYKLLFNVEDAGDDIYDTVLLVDRIRLKTSGPAPSSPSPSSLSGPGVDSAFATDFNAAFVNALLDVDGRRNGKKKDFVASVDLVLEQYS